MHAENNPPLHISLRYSHIISLKSFTDIFMNEPNTDYDIPRMNGRNSRMSWQYPFLFRSFDWEKERERERAGGREREREGQERCWLAFKYVTEIWRENSQILL